MDENLKKHPKVSILVPIYGTEKYIEKCARSLFEQTYDNIEYIFVNDCTKDASVEILKKTIEDYPQRKSQVTIISHNTNKGLAASRLTAFEHSTGAYLWCVDSDDYADVQAVSIIVPYMERGYDFISFNYYTNNGNDIQKFNSKPLTVNNLLTNEIPPSIWKCIARKELYTQNNILPVVGINSSEDYLLTARLLLVSKRPILLENNYLYYYNISNLDSYMNNVNVRSYENSADSAIIIFEYYRRLNVVEKFHNGLSCRLAMCYLRLKKVDSSNFRCQQLLNLIKEADRVVYFLTKLPLSVSKRLYIVRTYRRFILKVNNDMA